MIMDKIFINLNYTSNVDWNIRYSKDEDGWLIHQSNFERMIEVDKFRG